MVSAYTLNTRADPKNGHACALSVLDGISLLGSRIEVLPLRIARSLISPWVNVPTYSVSLALTHACFPHPLQSEPYWLAPQGTSVLTLTLSCFCSFAVIQFGLSEPYCCAPDLMSLSSLGPAGELFASLSTFLHVYATSGKE